MTAMFISTLQNDKTDVPFRLGRCLDSGVRALARCHIISVEGALRTPIDSQLMRRVHSVLCGGARRVRLDLSQLTSIDAAGVGELVAAFNATKAAGAVLDIAHAGRRIRRILEVTGVYRLLTVCGPAPVSRLERPARDAAPS
jgi:anti-anti-sigma factor